MAWEIDPEGYIVLYDQQGIGACSFGALLDLIGPEEFRKGFEAQGMDKKWVEDFIARHMRLS